MSAPWKIHNGVQYRAAHDGACVRWFIRMHDHLGRDMAPQTSRGGFYDNHNGQGETAYEAAESACRRYLDRTMGES